jgi:hypothetical protein
MFTTDYNHKATYWGSPSRDGWGSVTFDAPMVLDVRWENIAERVLSYKGEEFVSRAVIWVKIDLELGGYLFLGESVSADPTSLADAFEIRMIHEVHDFRGMFVERKVYL